MRVSLSEGLGGSGKPSLLRWPKRTVHAVEAATVFIVMHDDVVVSVVHDTANGSRAYDQEHCISARPVLKAVADWNPSLPSGRFTGLERRLGILNEHEFA